MDTRPHTHYIRSMLEHIHEVERAQTVYTQAQMQTHTKMKGNKIQQTESMQMPYGAHMQ